MECADLKLQPIASGYRVIISHGKMVKSRSGSFCSLDLQMPRIMKIGAPASLIILAIVLAVSPAPVSAQFIPCRIVNVNIDPSLIQAGQPFHVTSNLTISCDPSVLPVVRVDLLVAASSTIISSTSLPYYTYASSFVISVINQATAPTSPGVWVLEVRVYVINAINGQAVASSSQLFHVNVEPYTSVRASQSNATTTQSFTTPLMTSTQSIAHISLVRDVCGGTNTGIFPHYLFADPCAPLYSSRHLASVAETAPSYTNNHIGDVVAQVTVHIFSPLSYSPTWR